MNTMKNALGIFTVLILMFGCNMNPSKEARIQHLESAMESSREEISQLEMRVEILEKSNVDLMAKIAEIENQ